MRTAKLGGVNCCHPAQLKRKYNSFVVEKGVVQF